MGGTDFEMGVAVEFDEFDRCTEDSLRIFWLQLSCSGVPWLADSPREQTTKCAFRPARVSLAMIPPQANSMSSGCAPKASSGGEDQLDFGIGFIGFSMVSRLT